MGAKKSFNEPVKGALFYERFLVKGPVICERPTLNGPDCIHVSSIYDIYICIYIYVEREREREIYKFIYIYIVTVLGYFSCFYILLDMYMEGLDAPLQYVSTQLGMRHSNGLRS